jgi:hypothetical protein
MHDALMAKMKRKFFHILNTPFAWQKGTRREALNAGLKAQYAA